MISEYDLASWILEHQVDLFYNIKKMYIGSSHSDSTAFSEGSLTIIREMIGKALQISPEELMLVTEEFVSKLVPELLVQDNYKRG